MTEIRVLDLFGPICVDSEDGAKLSEQVHAALSRGETVRLDFSGITNLSTAFLHNAVGSQYASFGKDDLDRRLLWQGLNPTEDAVMRFVQRTAIRFYSATPSQRDALLAAAARYPGE